MHLISPHGRKLKWDLRFRNHDGKIVRIPGDRDWHAANRLGNKIDILLKAKRDGDPPPGELKTWIDNMDAKFAARLVELGLIPARRWDRNKSLLDHVEDWAK